MGQTLFELLSAKVIHDDYGLDIHPAEFAYVATSEAYPNPFHESPTPGILPCRLAIAAQFSGDSRLWACELLEDGEQVCMSPPMSMDEALRLIKDWVRCDRGQRGLLL